MPKQKIYTGLRSSRPCDILRLSRVYRLHSSDHRKSVEQFYIALGTPVALSCYLLYKYNEYDQLVSKDIRPIDYNDPLIFRDDFAAISFQRKNASLKTSYKKKEIALLSFIQAEECCKGVNTSLPKLLSSSGNIHPDDVCVINSHIRKIDKILGKFDIDLMLNSCSWGPGSTLSLKGDCVSASHKFDVECDITRDAYDLFGDVMLKAYPLWENLKTPTFRTGNKIVTVPKNAKTDRTIAIEPGLNTWIQLGIGRQIRRRLRFAGYNLDSDLKNQRGAYIGSITDSTATIDFKAASDTISSSLVEFLLPKNWFTVLDSARSHFYTLNGETHRSEKFSTMGNGFTFELESLIFVTLALAICETNNINDECVSIFGDDLILPPACVTQLTRICGYYGFTINAQKSFSSGPFRESCGSYYFSGMDVKPIFLKKDSSNVKDVYRLANSIRLLSHRYSFYNGCDNRFISSWRHLVECVPPGLRLRGPQSAGDAVLSSNLDESTTWLHKDGWEGFNFSGLPTVAIDTELSSLGLLLARLHTPSRDRQYSNSVSLRAKTRIVFKKSMFVALWYDFGPWKSGLLAG